MMMMMMMMMIMMMMMYFPVRPGFPLDLVLLTIGYVSLFKCGEMHVDREDGRDL